MTKADLLAALEPFARFCDAMEKMGPPFPQEGDVYTLESSAVGRRAITVEDFRRARKAFDEAPQP